MQHVSHAAVVAVPVVEITSRSVEQWTWRVRWCTWGQSRRL